MGDVGAGGWRWGSDGDGFWRGGARVVDAEGRPALVLLIWSVGWFSFLLGFGGALVGGGWVLGQLGGCWLRLGTRTSGDRRRWLKFWWWLYFDWADAGYGLRWFGFWRRWRLVSGSGCWMVGRLRGVQPFRKKPASGLMSSSIDGPFYLFIYIYMECVALCVDFWFSISLFSWVFFLLLRFFWVDFSWFPVVPLSIFTFRSPLFSLEMFVAGWFLLPLISIYVVRFSFFLSFGCSVGSFLYGRMEGVVEMMMEVVEWSDYVVACGRGW